MGPSMVRDTTLAFGFWYLEGLDSSGKGANFSLTCSNFIKEADRQWGFPVTTEEEDKERGKKHHSGLENTKRERMESWEKIRERKLVVTQRPSLSVLCQYPNLRIIFLVQEISGQVIKRNEHWQWTSRWCSGLWLQGRTQ